MPNRELLTSQAAALSNFNAVLNRKLEKICVTASNHNHHGSKKEETNVSKANFNKLSHMFTLKDDEGQKQVPQIHC